MDTPEQTMFILAEVQVIYPTVRSADPLARLWSHLGSLLPKKHAIQKIICSIARTDRSTELDSHKNLVLRPERKSGVMFIAVPGTNQSEAGPRWRMRKRLLDSRMRTSPE
jgi:hypothetical protein